MVNDNTSLPPPTKIELNSSFYLGPQDRPGDFITSQRLKLDNYNDWSHAIYIALSSRRKFGFLDGSITDFSAPCTKDDWVTIHCMLVSWIMNTIEPEVKSMLSHYDNAKKLWDDLKERFGVVNGPRIQQLKSDINRCEQSKTMPVAVYYSKLSMLWDELDKHEPLISCKCGNCICEIGKQHAERRDNDRLQQFLLGLYSEYYASLRSNLLSKDPLPTLNRAFQQVAQEERVRGISRVKDDPSSAIGFAVRAGRGRGTGAVDRPVYEKCKKIGHETAQCWSDIVCNHCQKKGHVERRCFELHGYLDNRNDGEKSGKPAGRGRGVPARANAASGSSNILASQSPNDASFGAVFTPEQWKAIAGLFGNNKIPENRLNGKFDSTSWIIDTGATHHVTGEKYWLFNETQINCPVGLPNGDMVFASLTGSVCLSDTITLRDILYVSNLSGNLLSINQLNDDLQTIVQFNNSMCVIQDQAKELIGMGVRRDGLYYFSKSEVVQHVSTAGSTSTLNLWHRRMGHPSEKVVKCLPHVSSNKSHLDKGCEVCFRAKHPRDRFYLSENKASRIFEKVHCDLWGPYRHPSSCDARYFLTIVDDYSHAIWLYLMIDKTEVFRMFMSFVAMINRQFSQTIKIVQSDNGTEFQCLLGYFNDNGILFQTSCVGTPQQNGRAERKHKHILNVARALRFQANLPIYFWGESVLTAAHLINRTPTPLLQNKSAFEILFNTSPSYDTIRTFGCLCFAQNHKAKGDKFASRSRKCIFMGYPFGQKGWKQFDLDSKRFFVSRDVKFFEDVFPFLDPNTTNITPEKIVPLHTHVDFDFADCSTDCVPNSSPSTSQPNSTNETPHILPNASTLTNPQIIPQQQIIPPSDSIRSPSYQQPIHSNSSTQPIPDTHSSMPDQPTASVTDHDETLLGRGLRSKFPNVRHKDYVTHTILQKSPSSSTDSSNGHPSGTPYPIAHYVNCNSYSLCYRNFIAAVLSGKEPRSFKEAMRDEGWRRSMQNEIRALENNDTWTMEDLPSGKKALGSQWVYRIKYKSNGSIERLKSRLVVLGNHQ